MANELYRTQVVIYFRPIRVTSTFFWIANNLLLEPGYEVAKGINSTLFSGFNWLYAFTLLLSDQCAIIGVNTRRIEPDGTATYRDVVPVGTITGGLPGPVGESWLSVWLKWHSTDDVSGKHGVRIGPVPPGVFQPNGYLFTYLLSLEQFKLRMLEPRSTPSGVEIKAAIRYADGTASAISTASVSVPTSRQINRRVRV